MGLSVEFQPVSIEGEDLYKFLFWSATSIHVKISTWWHVILDVTLICLSVAIIATNCFGVVKGGSATARTFTLVFHKCLLVINTMEETPTDQDILDQAIEAYKIASAEEAKDIKEMANLPDTGKYDVEPDFVAMDTESSDCQVVEDDKQGN